MRQLQWNSRAWEEYCQWQDTNKSVVKRINRLIREVMRSPFTGTGRPEALKENLSGFWSRRIDEENRLVYVVEDVVIVIISCKGHYN